MKWIKNFKTKIATIIITITATATTAGIIFNCSGEIKEPGNIKYNATLTNR